MLTIVFYDNEGKITGTQSGASKEDIASFSPPNGEMFLVTDDPFVDIETHVVCNGKVVAHPNHLIQDDLSIAKAEARLELDAMMQARRYNPNADIHAMKLMEARHGTGPLLTAEAAWRGISDRDLARVVIEKAQERADRIIMLEISRQRVQAAIHAATNVEEVRAALRSVDNQQNK